VASRAQLGNRRSCRLAYETFGPIHGLAGVFSIAITAVAVYARQPVRGVDIILDEQRWTLRVAIHCGVAVDAGILGGALSE
jgi:hypothetical protein